MKIYLNMNAKTFNSFGKNWTLHKICDLIFNIGELFIYLFIGYILVNLMK
jgi:hypothetical protein